MRAIEKPDSLWRNRNFSILLAGQWVSQAGNTFYSLALYWFVLSATHSRADLGLIGAATGITGVLGLLSGAFVDRWNRRRTMLVTDAVRAVLSALIGVMAALGHLPLWLLLVLVLALTAVGQFFGPAEAALLPMVVAPEQLGSANGANQGSTASANLLGATLGGACLGLFGPVALFFSNAASFLVSVGSLGLLKVPEPARPVSPRGVGALLGEVGEGFSAILANRFLLRVILVGVVANFAVMPLNVLDVAWVRQVLHQGALVYGLFGASILIGILTGSAFAGLALRRLGMRTLLPGTIALAGLSVAALSQLPLLVPDLVLLFAFGVVVAIVNTSVTTAVQQSTPDSVLGRVMGTLMASVTLSIPLGALLSGYLATALPLSTVFLGGGLLMCLSTGLALRLPAPITGGREPTAASS